MVELYFFIAFAIYGYLVYFLKYKYTKRDRPKVDGFGMLMMLIMCLAWFITAPCVIIGYSFSCLGKWISK